MINKIRIRNFACFEDLSVEFSPGVSVVLGENGTGKTQLVKWVHLVNGLKFKRRSGLEDAAQQGPDKTHFADAFEEMFQDNHPDAFMRNPKKIEDFGVALRLYAPKKKGYVKQLTWRDGGFFGECDGGFDFEKYRVVTIPTKELISVHPGLSSIFRTKVTAFDRSYVDYVYSLGDLLNRRLDDAFVDVRMKIEKILGGSIELEGERFVLVTENSRRGMHLVAEGKRKFAALWQLLSNGSIKPGDTLQIDEPEANLNPQLVHELTTVIALLSNAGVQVILATHSMYLVREIRLAATKHKAETQYILLEFEDGDPTSPVKATQSDDFRALKNIPSLRAELDQIERYEEMGW